MAQILRDPSALRQLDENETRAEIYEDYSQATPFERGVGILADALEHWGANDDGQFLRRSSAARRTTRDLEGRSYDIALHSDGRAPAWPPQHPDQFCDDDFGPCGDWSCFFDAERDEDTMKTLRSLFGMREALVITNATHRSRLKRHVEEGSTLLVRAARDVVKGDHLDKIVDLVKAPEDVDARSRTILAAAALALAQTRARVPVVVVERDDRTVVIRGASAARSAAADISVDMEEGHLRCHDLVAKVRRRSDQCFIGAMRTWSCERPPEPAFGASRVRQRWRTQPVGVGARLAGAEYRRNEPLWGAAREPLSSITVQARWPPRNASQLIDDAFVTHPTSFDDLRCPAWSASVRFDDEETPLADILSALSAAKLLADANPSDATLDNLECDLEDGPFAETARLLAGRTKTIVPERLDALIREVLGDSRPAMDSDEEEEDDDDAPTATSAKTCGAHDALALLALRLGGLSSLEAMSCVWATFLEALRQRWDAKRPLCYKPSLPEHGSALRERSAASVYCGRRRVDVCDSVGALETGCALQKLIATVDLSIRCSSSEEATVTGMAVQVACSPKLEREADALDRHGDGDAAAKRREDRRLATVASDVGAFKASHSHATVADFWRWAHPVDDPTVNVDPQVEALWDVVEATPCPQLKPLFDPSNEAEAALHALETARPRWVLGQLLACAATTAVFVLRDACIPLACVAAAIEEVHQKCASLVEAVERTATADLTGVACDSAVISEASRFIAAVAAAEGLMGRATALLSRLGDGEDAKYLAERLLAAECVAVDDLNERRAVANALRSYAATDGFLPPPTLREYVLWAADGTRAYASETNEGEVCYATAVARVD